jgi:hypothetical protein
MQEKIQDVLTMQKKQNTYHTAATVGQRIFLTQFVGLVVFTLTKAF